jgi:hypothetical protein
MSLAATPLYSITAAIASVWFVFWGYRRRYDLDYPLDSVARQIRWLMVFLGFGIIIVGLRWITVSYIRWIGLLWMLGFLVWPNFASHLTALLRRIGLARPSSNGSAHE